MQRDIEDPKYFQAWNSGTLRALNFFMIYAVPVICRVEEIEWLSSCTLRIAFSASSSFSFRAGQFISVVVPSAKGAAVKRCYSLASSPEDSRFELCVKVVPGGRGSGYLASLKVNDTFKAYAPYGHFTIKSEPKKNLVFISTATGIGPLRSMVLSREFANLKPSKVTFITGCRTEKEILFPDIEKLDIEVVRAISQPGTSFQGFKGRVTDYLRLKPATWHWHQTDFYICGNPEMVLEVEEILRSGRGVNPKNIFCELFSQPKRQTNVIALARPPRQTFSLSWIRKAKGQG